MATTMQNKNEQNRRHVIQKLNYNSPNPPPNIFYIRRDPQMLHKFLNDPASLDRAMHDSPKDHRQGFQLFKLQPVEKRIVHNLRSSNKKKLRDTTDPFFTKYTDVYRKRHSVIPTDKFIKGIRELDFKDNRNRSKDEVR